MNWEGFGRSCCDLISRYYSSIRMEGLRKAAKTLSQDSRSPGRDLNPGPPEYKARISSLIKFILNEVVNIVAKPVVIYVRSTGMSDVRNAYKI
jgi:hypothetical protein